MTTSSTALQSLTGQSAKGENQQNMLKAQVAGSKQGITQSTGTPLMSESRRTEALTTEQNTTITSWLGPVRRSITQHAPSVLVGKTSPSESDITYSFSKILSDAEIKSIQAAARKATQTVIILHLTRLAAMRPIYDSTPHQAQIRIEETAAALSGYSELAIIEGIKHAVKHPRDGKVSFPQVDELMAAIAPFDKEYQMFAKALLQRERSTAAEESKTIGYVHEPAQNQIKTDYLLFKAMPDKKRRATELLGLLEELQDLDADMLEIKQDVDGYLSQNCD